MLMEELTTSRKWLTEIKTRDQAEKPGRFLFSHSIASLIVANSWMFNSNLGRWQRRKTRTKPMKMAARLSSNRLLRSFAVLTCLLRCLSELEVAVVVVDDGSNAEEVLLGGSFNTSGGEELL